MSKGGPHKVVRVKCFAVCYSVCRHIIYNIGYYRMY